jgi:hypothetical protein
VRERDPAAVELRAEYSQSDAVFAVSETEPVQQHTGREQDRGVIQQRVEIPNDIRKTETPNTTPLLHVLPDPRAKTCAHGNALVTGEVRNGVQCAAGCCGALKREYAGQPERCSVAESLGGRFGEKHICEGIQDAQ